MLGASPYPLHLPYVYVFASGHTHKNPHMDHVYTSYYEVPHVIQKDFPQDVVQIVRHLSFSFSLV